MTYRDNHLSDEDLLLEADGELDPQRAAQVKAHLEACWKCRARKTDVEAAIAGFMEVHSRQLSDRIPPVAGSRALLKARLAEAASEPRPNRIFGAVAAAVIAVMGVGVFLYSHRAASSESPAQPLRSLTPGAVRPVTAREVCEVTPSRPNSRIVPVSLQREVFRNYGIKGQPVDAYEVDYLITPELGGADDVRNLWPEPYSAVWNARVKDDLEERLRQMVCAGQMDLHTAQHEIAQDWIAAYKKYFHADKPIAFN